MDRPLNVDICDDPDCRSCFLVVRAAIAKREAEDDPDDSEPIVPTEAA